MKVLVFCSDYSACFRYRILLPFIELQKFGVEWDAYCFIPSSPEMTQESLFLDMIKNYDLIIIQRCYLYELGMFVSKLCKFLGKPVIFETDDDYKNLIPSNPAYFSIVGNQPLFKKYYGLQVEANRLAQEDKRSEAQDKLKEANELLPELEKSRQQGLWGYTEILKNVDWVTTSTKELARTIYMHNKNVAVFENNTDRVYHWRDSFPLEECLVPIDAESNRFRIDINQHAQLGLYRVPNYRKSSESMVSIPRLGYSTSPSHKYEDFFSIKDALSKLSEKNPNQFSLTFLGDNQDNPWYAAHVNGRYNPIFTIPPSQHEIYNFNLRNLDIALCPLFPNVFNMSKSDLKLVEAGAWGVAGLAPRFITYSRNWIDEETCLMYDNEDEFIAQAERLIKSKHLRDKLGNNARYYVEHNRLEKLHSESRYRFYKSLVEGSKPVEVFSARS